MTPRSGPAAAAGAGRRGLRVGDAARARPPRRARRGPGGLRPRRPPPRAGGDARARRADARRLRGRGGGGARAPAAAPCRSPRPAGSGFAAELAGVATGRPFGRYTYSDKLGPRVGGVPLLAAAAWAMMARPAWVTAGLLARRRALRVARRRRRAGRLGRLPRPPHGARGLLDVAGRRPLRGRPGEQLPRLVAHGPGRVRRLGAAGPR